MADSTELTKDELESIKSNRAVRRALARNSHKWFFTIYMGHYIKYAFANFHHKIFEITEDESMKNAVIVAFRSSGKSTLMSLSYPIWAAIGVQQKKFILIITQTQTQARIILANIKYELENNELLKADVGPFEESSDEWSATSIVLSNYNVRITVASTEQSIRGLRHGENRPDLIVCDDIEDLSSVKSKESRDKTFNFLTGEVIPAGNRGTRIIIVGNLLHEDSLIMRFKKSIEDGIMGGAFYAYPLLDKDGDPLWPAQFPSQKEIDELRSRTPSESAWQREYLLRIISDEDRIVHPEWIHYYDVLPDARNVRFIATGVDLAISEKESADSTAMVSAMIDGYGEDLRVYILPNPINKRMTFPDTFETAKWLSKSLGGGSPTMLFIEDVGYQRSLVQQLQNAGYPAEEAKIKGQDKRARLTLTTHLIRSGKILFPRKGAEELIGQLTGFGMEKHDDLADAFAILILKILEDDEPEAELIILDV